MKHLWPIFFSSLLATQMPSKFGTGLGFSMDFNYINLSIDVWLSNTELEQVGPIQFGIGFGGYLSGKSKSKDFDGHEDFTSVFGTVNTFDDYERGIATEISDNTWGVGPTIMFFKNERPLGVLRIGFALGTYKENYYSKLYDPSEILGNNGKYYIETNIPSILEYNSGFYFSITKMVAQLSNGGIDIGAHYISVNDKIGGKINFSFSYYM